MGGMLYSDCIQLGVVSYYFLGGTLEYETMDNMSCENGANQTLKRPEKVNKDLTSRLNRIEGQVKGIKAMIERGEYCDDILTQISSVRSAMSAVGKVLVESHMRTCVAKKLQSGDEDIIEEFVKTVGRIMG